MTTLAHTGTVVTRTTPAQTRRRTMLMSLAMIAVTIGAAFVLSQLFLTDNRFSAADLEILRILSAAFAPSIVGLLLAFFGSELPDDRKQ